MKDKSWFSFILIIRDYAINAFCLPLPVTSLLASPFQLEGYEIFTK